MKHCLVQGYVEIKSENVNLVQGICTEKNRIFPSSMWESKNQNNPDIENTFKEEIQILETNKFITVSY